MSTKREEPCPECGTATPATDRHVRFFDNYGDFPVRQWSYECECCWSWANEIQRENNSRFHRKAVDKRRDFLIGEGQF